MQWKPNNANKIIEFLVRKFSENRWELYEQSPYNPFHATDFFLYQLKSVRIWSFSDPFFPAIGVNTEIYSVNHRFQSEYEKKRDQKNFEYGHFLCSVIDQKILKNFLIL